MRRGYQTMTLGNKLKKLRSEKGLTQKDLADHLHVTFQTVSKRENDENEPDIGTLKELSKLYGCSVDYLISEDETPVEEPKQEVVEAVPAPAPVEQVTKTIIIHQKEMHVCESCKKDIPEDDLAMEQICTRHASRGRSAEYRQGYYHKECLAEIQKQRAEAAARARAEKARVGKRRSFGWGIAGGVIALGISLWIFLANSQYVHPALGVLFSVLIGYAIFAMLYCIISGSYIGDVFVWCASASIKFPGLIFTWDIDGFIWVIAMKIFFSICAFLFGLLALGFAIGFSATLGVFSFPFVLIHNINTDYEDAF